MNPSSLPTGECMTGSSPKLLKCHSRNKAELMTAGSIFVRTAAIAVRMGRLLMKRRPSHTEVFLQKATKVTKVKAVKLWFRHG
jgi:hypothetical protein